MKKSILSHGCLADLSVLLTQWELPETSHLKCQFDKYKLPLANALLRLKIILVNHLFQPV